MTLLEFPVQRQTSPAENNDDSEADMSRNRVENGGSSRRSLNFGICCMWRDVPKHMLTFIVSQADAKFMDLHIPRDKVRHVKPLGSNSHD